MNISAEEKIMYMVMKAIYDSNIPISFKGSMVLRACLLEAGYDDEMRHTVDIDANWNSDTAPSANQMVDALQRAIEKSDIDLDLDIRLYRMYGENRSAGFELIERSTAEVLFTMDIDVNRPLSPTKIYEIEGIRFCGISPLQMVSDKIAAISTDKVFRRIKYVVDLYYISKIFKFNSINDLNAMQHSKRTLDSFQGFLYRPDDLRHSYEKFRFTGDVTKPPFEEIYQKVKAYIKDILPKDEQEPK